MNKLIIDVANEKIFLMITIEPYSMPKLDAVRKIKNDSGSGAPVSVKKIR